jgi:hypothetical protein
VNETLTVAIVAVAAVGLVFLLKSQSAPQPTIVVNNTQASPAAASNPLSSLAGLATAVIGAL